ncbi:hypothetical protein MWH28_12665, partial [Natroniella sulfidigena]
MDTNEQYRIENDTLGNIMIPKTAYYGAQTERAINNFPISGIRFRCLSSKLSHLIKNFFEYFSFRTPV